MKANVRNFLSYIRKETPVTFDLSTVSPTRKMLNSFNQPILINVLGINDGTLGLTVISCGCNKCKQIICVEVLYGVNGSVLYDAETVQNQIKAAVPSIPVRITNVAELSKP